MSESTSVFMTSSVPFARKAENNHEQDICDTLDIDYTFCHLLV